MGNKWLQGHVLWLVGRKGPFRDKEVRLILFQTRNLSLHEELNRKEGLGHAEDEVEPEILLK